MRFKVIPLLMMVGVLASCASMPVQSPAHFQLQEREYLYDENKWSFSGRAAMSNDKESASLSINWQHLDNQNVIELSGPFGQGRTILEITEDRVAIDDGEKRSQFVGDVDNLVARHAGISLPISAMQYWVLGLVKPDTDFISEEHGFLQSEWRVNFQQMQFIKGNELPKKIIVEREGFGNEKLKLIIDHWEF